MVGSIMQYFKKLLVVVSILSILNFNSAQALELEGSPGNIVGNTNSIDIKELNKDEAYYIFTLVKRYTTNGSKIKIILPPLNSYSFKDLSHRIIGTNTMTYYELIKAKEYAGISNFVFVDREDAVITKVATTANSIGYYYGTIAINSNIGIHIITIK